MTTYTIHTIVVGSGAAGLRAAGVPVPGFDAQVSTTLPPGGGLSSSAAFEMAVGRAMEALAGTAPLLPPRQIDALTDRLMAQEHRPDMTALLPFLPTEMVDELLRQQANQEGSLVRYAPFASEDAIDEIALSRSEAGKSFMELAPFISEDALNKIVFDRLRSGKNINQLLPFVDQSTILQLYEAGTKEPS